MDKFETQFTDLDVQTSYLESTMSSTTATVTPQDEVDTLMSQVADEAGLEIQQELGGLKADGLADVVDKGKVAEKPEEDDRLTERSVCPSCLASCRRNAKTDLQPLPSPL